jgi:putative transposase
MSSVTRSLWGQSGTVVRAYRFALEPTPAQERALRSHAGAARFAWNWALARCRDRYESDRTWLGTVKTYESTRKLARRLEAGTARILSATVSRTAQRWFVSFTCQVEFGVPQRVPRTGTAVGVDLGVKTLLTGVDNAGEVVTVTGPKALRTVLRRLRRASRAHSRKAVGSANRRRAASRLARIYARVSNVRADALHKATTNLARRYHTIVIEDLNVTGMLASRRLARAVADQGFGTARRLLSYKATWNDGQLICADRWYPSSKTCSACGTVKAKLSLSERTFICPACGHAEDRDVNAARNLLNLAASGAESLNACRAQVRPGPAGRRAQPRLTGKTQEPGAAYAGKTGTAGPQDPTAVSVTRAHRLATEQ